MSHTHGTLISLLVFVCAASFLFFFPEAVRAVYMDADAQCPPGGKINQPCKDNTHGYITKGKCAFVYVCKADNVDSKTPPICAGGKADCPVGGPPPASFNPYPKPIKIASGSPAIPASSISEFEANVLNMAFAGGGSDVSPAVNLENLSTSANASLAALLPESE